MWLLLGWHKFILVIIIFNFFLFTLKTNLSWNSVPWELFMIYYIEWMRVIKYKYWSSFECEYILAFYAILVYILCLVLLESYQFFSTFFIKHASVSIRCSKYRTVCNVHWQFWLCFTLLHLFSLSFIPSK